MSTLPESQRTENSSNGPSSEKDAAASADENATDENAGAADEAPAKPLGYDPDELQTRLQPHLNPKLAMGLPHVGITAIFCLLFFAFSFLGLRPLEVYSYVAYGDWILANGALPESDPFLQLAAGMPVDNSAWLSQVIFASVHRLAGGEALSATFAFAKVAVFVLFGVSIFLRSRSLLFVAAAVIVLGLAYGMRMLDTPLDIFGQLAFMGLLLLITLDDLRYRRASEAPDADDKASEASAAKWMMWIAVPLLFALWVNLHVSFIFGLLLMATWAVGHLWEASRASSFTNALADAHVRRRIWLVELGLVATLINPATIGAWGQAIRIAFNTNLRDQLPYSWLSFARYEGLILAVAVLLTMHLLRKSKTYGGFDFLAFAGFAVAAGLTVFAAPYLGAVVIVLASGHFAALCTCCAPMELTEKTESGEATARKAELPADAMLAMEDEEEENAPGRSFVYSLLCLLLIWLALMFTPTYDMVASPKEKQRSPAQLLGADSPWQVAQYLNENPLRGRVFAPMAWAGYFQVKCRTDESSMERQFFANAMTTHLPRRVWEDYMLLAGAGRNWTETFDRYDIRHVIVDKETQVALTNSLRNSEEWGLRYEDDVTLIASRLIYRAPEPEAENPPEDEPPDQTAEHEERPNPIDAGIAAPPDGGNR